MAGRRTHRSRRRREHPTASASDRYRYVIVPELRRCPRPTFWQIVGCTAAVIVSLAGLAWVFSGGAEAIAWPLIIPTR